MKDLKMCRKLFYLSLALCLIIVNANGQTLKEQFNDLLTKNDDAGQRALLTKWEKQNAEDPELFVAYFNYYANKSRKDGLALGTQPKGEKYLKLLDKDSTKKEPIGYIYDETYYDPETLKIGLTYITKGIKKYPTRLDMRFGKIYMYGQTKDYENFTIDIIKTVNYSAVINNKWTWADNKHLEKPKTFMLNAVQDYVNQLYKTDDDALLDNMKQIAEAVLKHYPDHVESISNVAIVHLLRKQYDQGLNMLFKAEKLAPKDPIVLNNIAEIYKRKGNVKKAIDYYNKIVKYCDEESKSYAKDQIEELKNKK